MTPTWWPEGLTVDQVVAESKLIGMQLHDAEAKLWAADLETRVATDTPSDHNPLRVTLFLASGVISGYYIG